jgi:hypothetical protein
MVFAGKAAILGTYFFRCVSGQGVRALFLRVACPALLILTIVLSTGVRSPASVEHGKADEYQVKAAFIVNFINFIEWPDTALPADSFTIGILGMEPSAGAIGALKGKTVKGRKLVVKHFDDPEEAHTADLLFISPSEKRSLPLILKKLRNRPVLTVGDQQGFARSGVMINMVIVRKRVGFEINLPASQRAGLRISSQLLKLAKEVVDQ